jgi:hypothetical protein
MVSQREMYHQANGQVTEFNPPLPRLTRNMLSMLAALIAYGSSSSEQLKLALGGRVDTRTLRRLMRKKVVVARAGRPATYDVTRCGQIAWSLRNSCSQGGGHEHR